METTNPRLWPAALPLSPTAILPPVLAFVVAAMIVAPRGAPVMLALAAFGLAASAWHQGRLSWTKLTRRDAMASAFLALGLLALASEFWQAAPARAWQQGASTCGIVLLAWLAAQSLPEAGTASHKRCVDALLIGFLIGFGLVLIESVTGQALHRWAYNAFPFIRPHESEFFQRDGVVLRVRGEQLNRSVAIASLLLWPVLGLLRTQFDGRQLIAASAALAGAALVLAFTSQHDSSKLALLTATLIAGLAALSWRAAWRTMQGLWIGLVLLCVPLALLAFNARLYENTSLQDSARARLILWGYTAGKVLEAPVLGIGAGAGRVLDDRRQDRLETLPGQPFELRTGSHQHNIYLQVWYELGAVGVVTLLIAGWLMLARIARKPPPLKIYALASAMAVIAMTTVSYGLWQAWFQAALAWPLLITLFWVVPEPGRSANMTTATAH